MLNGDATPAQIGAFLMALQARGETIEEITAGAQVMRKNAVRVKAPSHALDTCGTGGDGSGTYNISTAVAIIAAACGAHVAKHGNRALTSKSGSSEVLEASGCASRPQPSRFGNLHSRGWHRLYVRGQSPWRDPPCRTRRAKSSASATFLICSAHSPIRLVRTAS
jgi:anthranilate phosphoribosyltransferase